MSYTSMKCILMRYTPVRCTPMRRPPMRCIPMRYTPTVVWLLWLLVVAGSVAFLILALSATRQFGGPIAPGTTRDDYSVSGMVYPTEYLKNRFQHRFLTSTNLRNTIARPCILRTERRASRYVKQRNRCVITLLFPSSTFQLVLLKACIIVIPFHLAGVFVSLGWRSETLPWE